MCRSTHQIVPQACCVLVLDKHICTVDRILGRKIYWIWKQSSPLAVQVMDHQQHSSVTCNNSSMQLATEIESTCAYREFQGIFKANICCQHCDFLVESH
mmetsp:Transcript_17506/g.36266  ORF Transcript_17506/g.36266 Transcript_17506/m.36266 type:complete len:99 (-) Transcript_17506:1187-1483(-)